MRTRILIFIGAVGILFAAVLLFKLGREVAQERRAQAERVGYPPAATPPSKPAPSPGTPPPSAGGPRPSPSAPTPPPPANAGEEFHKWLADEAKQMDRPSFEGDQKKSEMERIARALTPAQAKQLTQTALNVQAPAGEKILSAYLLAEGGAATLASLQDLITAPLSITGPQPAHSEGEMRGMQEKSLRIVAIDGLIAQAQSSPAAREALERTIPSIPDPYIRKYAEQQFSHIKGH